MAIAMEDESADAVRGCGGETGKAKRVAATHRHVHVRPVFEDLLDLVLLAFTVAVAVAAVALALALALALTFFVSL